MKTLLTLLLILTSQILTSQMSYEFSTYLKNNNEFIDNYEPIISYNLPVEYKHHESNESAWKVLAVALTATIMEAIGDGLYDEGKATGDRDQIKLGKLLQAGSLGIRYFYIPIAKNSNTHWLWIPVVEIGVRMVTFDPSYNITRGLPINKIGSTSYWDQALSWSKQPENMIGWTRMVLGIATVKFTFDMF